ncbi:MAG TPA: response regulator receiver domain, partial [Negativicutes bacterium]|nr:response regulator receiver domain [Negativicutes bacterium]
MEQTEKENNSWRKHCRNAVKKFVMNAVVIDNEPFTAELTSQQNLVAQTASLIDDGMSEAAPLEIAKCPSEENFTDESSPSDGKLDIREISDAFADEEIACAFVLPKDGDRDENAILDRIVNASRHTDIIVLDWYLQDKNSALAEKVLKKIASIDTTEKGRMRLICVYTSQPLNDEIIDIALKCLRDGGLSLNKVQNNLLAARNEHHYLLLLNKQDVEGNKLPDRLLDAMIDLADGLLPAFSLSAVAAVRKNMHHIISRFSASLDNAFVANLLITDPPEDVTELIRELFISECDSALGLENVVDNCLNNKKVKNWLEVKKDTRSTELCALIENG